MQNEQVISYKEATGVIQYNMTNDYMFRYILQKNQKVLKGLICALLHLEPEEVQKVEITNPINLNEDIEDRNMKKHFPSSTSDFWIILFFQMFRNFTQQTC